MDAGKSFSKQNKKFKPKKESSLQNNLPGKLLSSKIFLN